MVLPQKVNPREQSVTSVRLDLENKNKTKKSLPSSEIRFFGQIKPDYLVQYRWELKSTEKERKGS